MPTQWITGSLNSSPTPLLPLMPRLLSLFVSVALATCLCAQEDLEARLDAVKEFTRYFRKAKEEALQVEAVMTLKGNECVPACEALLKLIKHKKAAVQKATLIVLASYTKQETFQELIDALPEEKDSFKVAVSIKLLGRSKIEGSVDAIEAAAGSPKASSNVRYEAARALMAIGQPGKLGLLGSFLSDKEPLVRLAACDAIAKMKVAAFGEGVTKLLTDPQWQVQTSAIEAVAQLRPQAAVQPLIDLLRKNGRLRVECADALFRVSGLDFGLDADRWQAQWDTLMTIEGWRIPTDAELAKKAASRKKYDALYGRTAGKPNAFAGIPTTSTNVLFVIDVSGSMDNLVVEVDKFRDYKDRKRFTIVQTELLNTIESLTADTNFNILSFATDTKPWKPRLVPANVVNRDSAISFVRRLKPIGGNEAQELAASGLGGSANLSAGKTNTLKALLYGFGVNPDKPAKPKITGIDKKALKRPLDTIYFLSDGRPSAGKLLEPDEILAEVRKHNEQYKLVIHTIAIGDFQKGFLQQLAEKNGGVFVDMGR
ncbi:MAG: HEAT repeat protein [Planctomycetota bacterium]|jgi:HEAT repeat protein